VKGVPGVGSKGAVLRTLDNNQPGRGGRWFQSKVYRRAEGKKGKRHQEGERRKKGGWKVEAVTTDGLGAG